MKRFGFSNEIRTGSSGDEMILEGRAIVFDSPTVLYEIDGVQYKEVIDRKALDRADLSDVVLRYNHSGEYTVLARTRNRSLKLEKRQDGLYMQAKLQPDISQHVDVYNAVKSGLIDKMSFAFSISTNGDNYDQTTHTRTVTNIRKLFDLSIVDQPAYDNTFVEARSGMEQHINFVDYREAVQIRLELLKRRLKNEQVY